MNHWLKRLGRDALVYGIGGLLARGVSVLLLPVYTHLFTPQDYGQIEMMNTVVGFMGAFLGLGMDSAQSLYFTQTASEGVTQQAIIVSAIFQWRLLYGLVIFGLCCGFIPILNQEFFANGVSWHLFFISFLSAYFGQFLSQTVEIQRLLFRPYNYVLITLGNSLLSILLGLFLVIYWKLGIAGFFWASFISTTLFAGYSCWQSRLYINISKWHTTLWPKLLKFGFPFLPEAIAMYVMNTANRWFLVHYHGQEALGIFSVGLRFSLLMVLAVNTFRQAFMPTALEAMNHTEGPKLFRNMAYIASALGTACIVFMTATSKIWLICFTTSAYYSAYPIIGLLSWQAFFYGFYLISSVGIWKSEKSYLAPFNLGISALVNILICCWLIPDNGIVGAAFANAAGFFIWNILSVYWSERLWIVHFPKTSLLRHMAIGIFSTLLITLQLNAGSSWSIILFEASVIIIYFIYDAVTHFPKAKLKMDEKCIQ